MKAAVIIARTSAGWHLLDAGEDIAEIKSIFKLLKVTGSHEVDGKPADLALYFDTSGERRKKVLVSPSAVAAKTAARPAADPAPGAPASPPPDVLQHAPAPESPAAEPAAVAPADSASVAPAPAAAPSAPVATAPEGDDITSHFAAGKAATARRRSANTSAPGSAASVSS